jgi:hypothetical protein
MSQKWKITFSFNVGPIPKGQVIYVTTESNTRRPTEAEIKDALRSIGIETDKPWTGIGSSYIVDYGH